MATTTNFGWETPDDTDLVKDGALAIRTLGSAIDTSLVDLKGGTTGQVLSKTSNTDMDFTWVAQDDSNAIQNAIVDAKGDLITATAADTPARLAVGTNGQVLTADSTTATGLKWATAASGTTFAGASVYPSADSTLSNNTFTLATFNSETYDTDGYHSTTTNTGRMTIPSGKAGYYLFNYRAQINGGIKQVRIYKNGTGYGPYQTNDTTDATDAIYSGIWYGAVGDYFEIYVKQISGASQTLYGSFEFNNFQIAYLGA
jgi:hypothetical protein